MAKVRNRIPESELPGETLTRDHVAAFADPRDSMSKDYRVKTRDELERFHEINDDLSKVPYGGTSRMVGGAKGKGRKTSYTTWRAMQHYAAGGYVFSNHGLGFGQALTLAELVTFAERVPPQSLLVVDEGHLVASTYGANSLSTEIALNSLTMTRHIGSDVYVTSTAENRLDWRFREDIRTAVYPGWNYHPSSGEYHYPPECYIWPWLIGDYPWGDRSPRLEDIHLPKQVKRRIRAQRMPRPISPREIYIAWSLFDSWSEPSVSEGAMTTADQLRRSLAGPTSPSSNERTDADEYFTALLSVWEGGDWQLGDGDGRKTLPWRTIDRAAREGGYDHPDELSGLRVLQEVFGEDLTQRNRLSPRVLREFLVKLAVDAPLED